MTDNVNHPPHYNHGRFETLDVIEDWGLHREHHLANVIKYISRFKHKANPLEDLKKAAWYLDRKIKRMEDGLDD